MPAPLVARTPADSSLADDSVPELTVRVYSFPALSAWALQGAETEAARMLHPVDIELIWVTCTSRSPSPSCDSSRTSADLIVRIVAKALPQAGEHALGIAGSSDDYGIAFIFYDRVASLRTHTRLLPVMLGRVMAHEIAHLLLPEQSHAGAGLMRGQWAADDLQMTSMNNLGLSAESVQFMQKEALRRILSAHSIRK
ncbi:MAG TPA: hypothetical protein VH601_03235 [Bryobacteraceae bacterium]